jgi:hypothetical protein
MVDNLVALVLSTTHGIVISKEPEAILVEG